MNRVRGLVQTLGLNAVPILGVFFEGWSTGTALALYWFENLAGCLFIAARIALHDSWERKHLRTPSSRLGEFLSTSLGFNLAHGFFLGLLLFLMLPEMAGYAVVQRTSLVQGAVAVLIILALSFAFDFTKGRYRSYGWIDETITHSLTRMTLIHITIVFGMFALAMMDKVPAFFGTFAVLKALFDVLLLLPVLLRRREAVEPP